MRADEIRDEAAEELEDLALGYLPLQTMGEVLQAARERLVSLDEARDAMDAIREREYAGRNGADL